MPVPACRSFALALCQSRPLSGPQFPPLSNEGMRSHGVPSFYDPLNSMNKEEPRGKAGNGH